MNLDHFWAYLRDGLVISGKSSEASLEPGSSLALRGHGSALIIGFQRVNDNRNVFLMWVAWVVPI